MNKDEYKCEACGNIYKFGWTEEEAKAEAEKNFGKNIMDENPAIICDDCYKKMFPKEVEEAMGFKLIEV